MTAKQETGPWDAEVDVVVVGFGGAGVCAALEAAQQGASVLVLDRCHGGGSTAASGGVIYAGGGTPYQKADVYSPPRYTPPPWEAKEVSFVEMR